MSPEDLFIIEYPYDNYAHTRGMDFSSSALPPGERIAPNRPEGRYAMLNHASLPYVRKATSEACFEAQERLSEASVDERQHVADDIRKQAAAVIGGSDPQCVVFAENTTTVNSIAGVLLGVIEQPTPTKVFSNAEHIGAVMALQQVGDHSNRAQDHKMATTFDSSREPEAHSRVVIVTDLRDRYLNVFAKTHDEILAQIEKVVPAEGSCIVEFSHVCKETGRILPVKEMTAAIMRRNPQAHVIVDGAQAVGYLPQVDVEDIGCHVYLYPAHKGLQGRTLGVAYVRNIHDPVVAERVRTICGYTADVLKIHPETFHKDLHAESNREVGEFPIENVVGLAATFDDLRKHNLMEGEKNFSGADNKRKRIRDYLRRRLVKFRDDVDIVEWPEKEQSNAILSFRIADDPVRRMDDHALGKQHLNLGSSMLHAFGNAFALWQAWRIKWEWILLDGFLGPENVEMSFFGPRNLFRTSFSPETKIGEADHLMHMLEKYMPKIDYLLKSWYPGAFFRRAYVRTLQLYIFHIGRILAIPFKWRLPA